MRISIGELPLKNIDADLILHPVKYKDSITYEPKAEEALMALIAKYFVYDKLEDEFIRYYFDNLDEGYLFSESNFSENDLKKIEVGTIIVGRDIFLHPKFDNIKKFLFLLHKYASFNIENLDFKDFIVEDYELSEIIATKNHIKLEDISELDTFNGSVVYECADFSIVKEDEILCSTQFVIANKIKSQTILVDDQVKKVKNIKDLKGTFGIIYNRTNSYPFRRVKIKNLF